MSRPWAPPCLGRGSGSVDRVASLKLATGARPPP